MIQWDGKGGSLGLGHKGRVPRHSNRTKSTQTQSLEGGYSTVPFIPAYRRSQGIKSTDPRIQKRSAKTAGGVTLVPRSSDILGHLIENISLVGKQS